VTSPPPSASSPEPRAQNEHPGHHGHNGGIETRIETRMQTLTPAAVADYAARVLDPDALDQLLAAQGVTLPIHDDHPSLAAVRRAHAALVAARATGAVYGLTTGVGALRHIALERDDVIPVDEAGHDPHAIRLLRSHAAGLGPELDDGLARATMLVRLNQLLQGGSGVHPRLVVALAEAVSRGAIPRLHAYGAIGTADLTVLSELALTLAGELPWRSGASPATIVNEGDALPFISSNAMTTALSAIALTEIARLAGVTEQVAALSHLALRGSLQAYDVRILASKDHPHATAVAQRLSALLGGTSGARASARLQDPFGLRALPQVHGTWEELIVAADQAVAAEIYAAGENPLTLDGTAYHHGQFLTQRIAAALDGVRLAAIPALNLSVGRLAALFDPDLTELPPFLAVGPAGSSGLMILEYVANDLLARARTVTSPVTANRTIVSLGLEEHASHSTQSAWQTQDLGALVPQVLACELVAAVRALRLAPERLHDCPAVELYERAVEVLPDVRADHVLGPELEAATELIGTL
jgi:histidine ammonia-lyase